MLRQLDGQQKHEVALRESDDNIADMNSRLGVLENELSENKLTMDKLRGGLDDLLKLSKAGNSRASNRLEVVNKILQKDYIQTKGYPRNAFNFSAKSNPVCQNLNYNGANCDIEMNSLYGIIDWSDVNGGAWKQGFEITTSDREWQGRKLKIHLVPHSHNDPGWLKTYEEYFRLQTRQILDNVVDHLALEPKRRFIWAEMSYLSMWYAIADQGRREKAKHLIKNGQLEIVTGGWVMNDEANTHYFAMIDQMIEGHEWLSRTFGVTPKSGWAIDPFGHTPTMAYLLNRMGLSNMIIQRVHYSVKREFAKKKTLEFRWRQEWDRATSTDITCHLMPFYSYDVPHTCGPDPKICCQFDFGRLPGTRRNCPWGSPPRVITDANIQERALTLLDQYRKKSKLYKTDTLLVILGDDFRYDKMPEVEAQFSNYAKLFEYINSHPELNAEAKFSTLSEYFDGMLHEAGGAKNLPSLSGDFFTYADRQDHYWSGYYTSRAFYKTQERNLEAHVRGAEILFSLARPIAKSAGVLKSFSDALFPLLKKSRRNLGLFQHHDGITGTSKDPVVVDYGRKIQTSIMNTKEVISRCAELVLLREPSEFKPAKEITIDYDAILASHDRPEEKVAIHIDKTTGLPTTLVIYNSLSHDRVGLVRVHVTDHQVQVVDSDNQPVPSQTNVIWTGPTSTRLDQFELVFVATVAATGLATYKISHDPHSAQNSLSNVKILNMPGNANLQHIDDFLIEPTSTSNEEFSLDNEELTVFFSTSNGLMKSVTTKRDDIKMQVAVDFGVYSARGGKERGGAYLFLPEGQAKTHLQGRERPVVRIVEGTLLKEVHVLARNVEHIVSLHVTNKLGPSPFGIFVTNKVDIRSNMDNKELSMRITAPDAADPSDPMFYTDLNGLQIQTRKTMLDKIPIQANFYPMPTMAFIQNQKTRLSVFTAQPRGVASLLPSQIEIILDRRMMQDDNRGMAQAMKDNLKTFDHFVILIERWNQNAPGLPETKTISQFPSMLAHHSLLNILHPMWTMHYKGVDPSQVSPRFKASFTPLPGSDPRAGESSLPCSIHIVNVRSLESKDEDDVSTDEAALILQNFGNECHLDTCTKYRSACTSLNNENSISFPMMYPMSSVKATSLSLQHDKDQLSIQKFVVEPMEVKSYKVTLK